MIIMLARKFSEMIHSRRIEPHEIAFAKELIYRVAHTVFKETRPLEIMIADLDSSGALEDLDNIHKNYFEKGGTFLAMFDEQEMIGTGAIQRFESDTCELKRFWLLTTYHGQGLGYRMMQELLTFARSQGYQHIRLETHADAQRRAFEFYQRIGFRAVPIPNQAPDEDTLMEMEL